MDIELLAQGKTKWIERAPDRPGEVKIRNLPNVTWNDEFSVQLPGKDVWSAQTSANVFEFLATRGIPVAYVGRAEELSCFYALACDMIPIEVVVRLGNEPNSSYSMRNPDAPIGPFKTPQVEFFLKTAKKEFDGRTLEYDDPYIVDVLDIGMNVRNPKAPVYVGEFVRYTNVFGANPRMLFRKMASIAERVGTELSSGFRDLGWKLGDFKIELGRTPDGRIVLADDLNNDSWRAKDTAGIERSKQQVRNDNRVTPQTALNYQMVTELTARMR